MTIYLDENKVKNSLDAVRTYANIKCRIKLVDFGEVISDSRSNCFEIENIYFNNYDNTLVIVRGLSYFLEIKYCKDVEYRFETYQPGEIKERKEINELMKYRFHNSYLSHIAVKKDRVELTFPEGVCKVNGENSGIKQMDNFKLIANVDDPIFLWRSTTAFIIRYGKGGEIVLSKLMIKKILKKEMLSVSDIYYSGLDRELLIIGTDRKSNRYEIEISLCTGFEYKIE